MPGGFDQRVQAFQKLILVKVFHSERMMQAMMHFVGAHLGKEFTEDPRTSMHDIYDDLDNKTPCVFVLSNGADPTGMLLRFANCTLACTSFTSIL